MITSSVYQILRSAVILPTASSSCLPSHLPASLLRLTSPLVLLASRLLLKPPSQPSQNAILPPARRSIPVVLKPTSPSPRISKDDWWRRGQMGIKWHRVGDCGGEIEHAWVNVNVLLFAGIAEGSETNRRIAFSWLIYSLFPPIT